ncbi:hypothetical protein BTA51_08085 [Hahella sp. CCB-MM4]|uniref:hypothetical protein n=1 Tax=Hahella sp. (strain CCB-MM4) TaxID=1926491 RepID=UPI000B9C6BD1|nr:hypothetical protein [Hahella sp. CCB-MM4]OZG73761.1 hypothetical protein BTA51_08085 [Hahella sp. CCB-MM4]
MNTQDLFDALVKAGVIKTPDSPSALWNIIEGYAGDKAISYDLECIENPSDYRTVFSYHLSAFRKNLQIGRKDYESFLDYENERAGISVVIDGEKYSAEWEQQSDWVVGEFYDFLHKVIEPMLPGKFVEYVSLDQCYYGIYVPKEVADPLEAIFREYDKLQHEW